MTLWVLGLNHQTAPVDLRARLAFAADTLPTALSALCALPKVKEAALLSTCNRTELYAVAPDSAPLNDWLDHHAQAGGQCLRHYLYQYQDQAAVRHLFRVATGLDSMVLGEPQILGQVKDAWAMARQHGALGRELNQLFQQTFVVAKRARTDTQVGANPVSIASTAVRLAQNSFANLSESTVLLVGAGETIELAARHLSEANVKRLLIANRTLANAQTLASRHSGYALPLSELDRHLEEADVVFSATSSVEPIISKAMMESALQKRRHKPMLLFDLAVPRDIAADIASLPDAYLYTVDDLERAVEENRQSRREAAQAAEAIIDLHVTRYLEQQQAKRLHQPLKELRAFGEATRVQALEKALQQLHNGQPPEDVVQRLAHALTNQLLHAPTIALRDAALHGDASLGRAVERLFPSTPLAAIDEDSH